MMGVGVGVLPPQQLAAQARIVGYDTKLRMRAMLDDIYSGYTGLYDVKKESIPDNAIVAKIGSDIKIQNGIEGRVTMKVRLGGTGVYGNQYAIGRETRPQTRTAPVYCNNLRKVVEAPPGYGRRKLEADPYKLYEKHVDEVGDWNKHHKGLEYRQSFVERYGETLIYGDTQAQCQRNWNPHVMIAGLPHSTALVAYSQNRAQYTTNIAQAILAQGGGSFAQNVQNTLLNPTLSTISNIALQRRVPKIRIPQIPGGMGWILTVSERQANFIGDATWSARNLGTEFVARDRLKGHEQLHEGVLGYYKTMLICTDVMQPVIIPGGTSAPFSLTTQYVWPGDDDQRERDNPWCRDTFFLHGMGSIWDWTPEPLHWIKQDDDYEAINGRGSALVRGVQLPIYDLAQTIVAGQRPQYWGGILGICGLPDIQ